jgi:LytS/YehU family sensor histidine kinase
MRLGDRLKVEWAWDDRFDSLCLPPFLVQPLVENALKHGISPHPRGGVLRIGLLQEETDLVLRVSNTGKALPPALGQGIGRSNLEARLGLAFGDGAKTRLFTAGEWTVAEIRVDMNVIGRKA